MHLVLRQIRRNTPSIVRNYSLARQLPKRTLLIPPSPSKDFSATPQRSSPVEKPPGSRNHVSKLVLGSLAVGTVLMAAYQTGYIGQTHVRDEPSSLDPTLKPDTDSNGLKNIGPSEDPEFFSRNEESGSLSNSREAHLSSVQETNNKENEAPLDSAYLKDLQSSSKGERQEQVGSGMKPIGDDVLPVKEDESTSFPVDEMTSNDKDAPSETSPGDSLDMDKSEKDLSYTNINMKHTVGIDGAPISEETGSKATAYHQVPPKDMQGDTEIEEIESVTSLPDAYFLREVDERSLEIPFNGEEAGGFGFVSEEKEASVGISGDLKDGNISKDGKLVLDFLAAIHTAERNQAEFDAHIFAEERRIMKDKYEKELKDARARELMYAEEAALLEKELNKERAKAAATVKSLQERADEKLKMELQQKEEEAELQMKLAQELAKAEIAAAIANEKSSQLEKLAEADLHINALCMAFYARSEEARQSHSVHKLALGALALEDALSRGSPVKKEIAALQTALEGIDKDSLIGFVLLSIPEETLDRGTNTQLQLAQKFEALKGSLRHFSLIPAGGGGILTHTLAYIASSLKVREDDQFEEGIESVINRVESFLAEGKLAEAADALEGGVCGSQAVEIVGEWVRHARNRAVTEQALTLLQSYATSVSFA